MPLAASRTEWQQMAPTRTHWQRVGENTQTNNKMKKRKNYYQIHLIKIIQFCKKLIRMDKAANEFNKALRSIQKETLKIENDFRIESIIECIKQVVDKHDYEDIAIILPNKLHYDLHLHQILKKEISKNEELFIFEKICYNQKQANIIFGYSPIFLTLSEDNFLIMPVAKTTELIN